MRHTLALALVLPLLSAACTPGGGGGYSTRVEPTEQHPLDVVADTHSTRLDADGAGHVQVSANAIRAFVIDYARRGHGPVVVQGAAPDVAATARLLTAAGVRAESVLPVTVVDAKAVTLRFDAYAVKLPECGKFSSDHDSMLTEPFNRQSSEFGCATQRNLGMMVSNPADLARARGPEDPYPSTLSAEQVLNYGKYTPPAAPQAQSAMSLGSQ